MKRQELNYMNAIACLFVILIHVFSFGIPRLEPASIQAALIYFPWRIAAYVVPMFIYTGAIKLAQSMEGVTITPRVYGTYILRRIRKIYVPYVIWVALYYLCFMRINYVNGTWEEFFSAIIVGNLSAQFYYIALVMQFYILMPLLMLALRRVPAIASILVSIGVYIAVQLISAHSTFLYFDRIIPTYLIFFAAGAYVGKNYEKLPRFIFRAPARIISAAVIIVCAVITYRYYVNDMAFAYGGYLKLISDAASIIFLHSVSVECLRAPQWIGSALSWIAKSSYFVYLSHCVVLTLVTYRLIGHSAFGVGAMIFVQAAACYTIPFIIFALYDKITAKLTPLRGILG